MRSRTKRAALAGVALAVLCAASGCGGARGRSAADEDPTRRLFRRHCAACHGPDGAGGQVGTLSVPSLRDERALGHTEQQLFEQIARGSARGMPAFNYTLTDEEMRILARFVREEIQGRR